MGFLDNTTITVDAILTKVGRRKLSAGTFNITRYALSDEEIDYTLYDVSHPNGTDSYGTVIENMNLLEAVPIRDNFMSYLVNESPAGATLNISPLNHTSVDYPSNIPLNPQTIGGPTSENYNFTIANRNVVRFKGQPGLTTKTGTAVILAAQQFGTPSPSATTTVTVTGVESGLVAIVTITVNTYVGAAGDAEGPGKDSEDYGAGYSAGSGYQKNEPLV